MLSGFSIREVGVRNIEKLWLRGGFPPSYLAPTNGASLDWRSQFIRTFLERDLPQLGVLVRATTLRRFWSMLAHYHGQILNSSEFARSFAELDLLIVRGSKRIGFEIKRTTAPTLTRSMIISIADLKLSRLFVVHAGKDLFPLAERVIAIPADKIHSALPALPT